MRNYVAILAAGKGSRMGLSQPKQFEMLHGKTILEHSIDTFEKHPLIDGIFIVVHSDFIDNTRRLLNVRNRPKIIDIIAGGEERMDSSYNAILALENHITTQFGGGSTAVGLSVQTVPTRQVEPVGIERRRLEPPPNEGGITTDCNLLIHDAARPFISENIITRTIEALKNHSAVSVAIPATDTIYTVIPAKAGIPQNEGNSELQGDSRFRGNDTLPIIVSSPKRENVYHAQTPQAARLSVFKQAYDLGVSTSLNDQSQSRWLSGVEATDDATVILNYLPNEKIHIVLGDVSNRKITFQSDLL
ncbi:MAG: 2-C-methyl-D-erythritol 4-phosphate cytidylyltransferase [Bacteroidales bacterium]|nr:2-C-methyl-D-erythritol 4-phosphate cytidylyltransferase [Bacteroidales bacterium]